MLEKIKILRERTGSGMSDCKIALESGGGDMDKAMKYLREKGIATAEKRVNKDANEGFVAIKISENNKTGFVVEVNCETDFVAKGEKFHNLVQMIIDSYVDNSDTKDLLSVASSTNKTLSDELFDSVASIGEKLAIKRYHHLSVNRGMIVPYIHNASPDNRFFGRMGVLVALESDADADILSELGKKIAMHIAASNPLSLSIDDLNPEIVSQEKDILLEQLKNSNKPDSVIEKIIEGKMRKFYEDSVLLEQAFVMDNKVMVKDVVTEYSKNSGCNIVISDFIRYQLGQV